MERHKKSLKPGARFSILAGALLCAGNESAGAERRRRSRPGREADREIAAATAEARGLDGILAAFQFKRDNMME